MTTTTDNQTDTSSTPTTPKKETTQPALQILQIDTTTTITVPRLPKTAQIMPSSIIKRPASPPPSPESPLTKKLRTKSPATNTAPMQYFHVDIEEEYPLHEKYGLQDVTSTKFKAIAKAARLSRDDEEIKVDLPVYFVYHRDKHWTLIKVPTSKFYDEVRYEYIEQLYKRGTKQLNSAYWYDTLEKSCSDPLGGGGGPPLLCLVLPSYLGMTYS